MLLDDAPEAFIGKPADPFQFTGQQQAGIYSDFQHQANYFDRGCTPAAQVSLSALAMAEQAPCYKNGKNMLYFFTFLL